MRPVVKAIAFSLVAAAMLFAVGSRIVSSEARLSRGKRIKIEVRAYDPGDLLRGSYLALSLPGFASGRLSAESAGMLKPRARLYAGLEEDSSGFAVLETLRGESPPGSGYLAMECDGDGRLLPPFDRFYLNQEEAPEAEKLLFSLPDGEAAYVIAHLKDGQVSPSELRIGERSFKAGNE